MTDPHAAAAHDGGGVRERILDAALAILREEGIQELTQVQVSRRAGVRQSHLTYYFPRRADLLAGVGGWFVSRMEHGLHEAAGQAHGGDARELVRRLGVAIGDPAHMRMFVGVIVAADREPALRELIIHHTRRIQEMLARVLGGDDGMERAGLVLASLWGLGLYGFAMGEPAGPASSLLDCLSVPREP